MRMFLRAAAILLAAFFLCGFFSLEKDPYYNETVRKSVKYHERRLKDDPYNKMHYYNLASVYKEFGENRRAFDLYRELIVMNDKENRARFELAKMYYFLGALTYAEEEIKNLVRKDIVNWEVYFWWGCILDAKKDYPAAIEKFNKAAEEDINRNVIYVKLARLYEKEGDLDKAIKNYLLALKHDRTYTELNKKIAVLYERKKDNINAFNYWKKVGEIDTKAEEPRIKLEQLEKYIPKIKEKIEEFKEKKKNKRLAYVPPGKIPVISNGEIPVIKVGLVKDVRHLSFKCGSDFNVLDHNNKIIFKGKKLKEYYVSADKKKKKFYFSNNGKKAYFKKDIYMLKDDRAATTSVYNVKYGEGFYWAEQRDVTYRGNFYIKASRGKLTLINLVNAEEYLFGVIPSEMPASWPEEALKAQAVAARTYTFKHMGRHKKEGYDICATQHCAVYRGIETEIEKSDKAVMATKGIVLVDGGGKMLSTFYSHCCGGHTQDVSDVWGLRKLPGLSGVLDGKKEHWKFPLKPFYLEEWVRTVPDSYCKANGSNGVSFRWIRYLTGDDLEYFVNRKYKIGRVKELIPLKRAKGGALTKILIKGSEGKKTVKFDPMRNALGKIRGNVIKWEYSKDGKGFIKEIFIYGAGWGHGVGMCQRGAKGMAEKGKNFREILMHYYPGTGLIKKY